MKLQNDPLWFRIEAFQLDDPLAELPFSVRLARENHWTLRYTQRVIEEYKKFVYLTRVAGRVVCPSEEVDEVWHLHLCYTRSYWHDLCDQILGGPLHHNPTLGGRDQLADHREMYEQTLAAYSKHFGQEPPTDIWPPTDERFHLANQPRKIKKGDYWLIRKPKLAWFIPRRHWEKPVLSAGAVLFVPTLGAFTNPLDMKGPDFLIFYIILMIVGVIGACLLRVVLKKTDDDLSTPDLHPLDIATLASSEKLAMQVALADLAHRGIIELRTDDGTTLYAKKSLYENAHPLSKAIYTRIEKSSDAVLTDVWQAGKPHAAKIAAKLETQGLLMTPQQSWTIRFLPSLVMFGILLVGIAKICVGLSRDKPVAFLVILTVITAIITIAFVKKPWRTKHGDRILKQLHRDHRQVTSVNQLPESDNDLVMQWCLYGMPTMLLTGGIVTELHNWMMPTPIGGSGGSTGCGGGDGCGGDGGCGGGGCGGCGD